MTARWKRLARAVRVTTHRRPSLFDAPSQHHLPFTIGPSRAYPDGGPVPFPERGSWRHVNGFAVHLWNTTRRVEFRRFRR